MHPIVRLILDDRTRQCRENRVVRQAYIVISICYTMMFGAAFVIGTKAGYGAEDMRQVLEWLRQ